MSTFMKRILCFKTFLRHGSSRPNPKIVKELYDRKMLEAVFPAENTDWLQMLASGKYCIYAGFDPTAQSLHLGNLAVLIALLHWQRAGHQAIALVGGATAMIGDPSGKTHEREVIEEQTIKANSHSIHSCIQKIIKNHNKYFWEKSHTTSLPDITILNNASWYKDQNVVRFLMAIGRNFRLSKMLSRSSVKARMNSGEGMNFTEFSYQIFQSYDWLYLFDNYSCLFQIGGSDQLGNIEGGHDLIKKLRKKDVYGFMVPLIKATSGDKFGKTAGNAVWLDPSKTTPFELYQYFLTLPDKEVLLYLKYFTFEPLKNLSSLLTRHMEQPEKWLAQKKVAEDVTLLVHGEEGLKSALQCTEALFYSTPATLGLLSEAELRLIFKQSTTLEMMFEPGTSILDIAMKTGIFNNIRDANRIVTEGGFYVNSVKMTNPNYVLIPEEHILLNGITLVRFGKKTYFIIKWTNV